jgi:ABC-2 type transport system permease protein
MSTTATLERAPVAPTPPAPAADVEHRPPRRVWFRVYRHHLRVLRNQAIAWILSIAGVGAAITAGYQEAYPTLVERQRAAASLEGVPAFEALFGRTVEMATVEGFILWRWGGFAVLVVAAWGMLSAAKLLRGAEDLGHVEPLRAGTISPRGLLTATMAALGTVYALLAVAVALAHTSAGFDATTAWVFGAGLGLLAATFAGVAAVAAQVVASRRHVLAVTGSALGVLLAVRVFAAGSGTPDWLWGATPFGWMSHLHEVDGARAAVLVAFAVLVAALAAGAVALGRRDLHAGLADVTERTVSGARPVRTQHGLALRSTSGSIAGWGAGLVGGGLVFGLLAEDFAAAMADLPDTVAIGEQIGWAGLDTPEGIVASMVGGFLVVLLALFGVSQAAAIRDEEATWRIEHLLVRPVGRIRWLLTRTVVAAVTVAALALATAVSAWVGTALAGTGLGARDTLLVAVNLVPITWMFLGLAVALFGLAPRLTAPVAYAVVLVAYVLDIVGGILEIPERILELGPFRHLAAVPAADMAVGAAVVMVVVAVVGVALGVVAFRRRDLQEA